MAYFALIWKARMIEKYRLRYEREKLNSIRIMNAQNPQKETRTFYQKICHLNSNTKKRISKTFLRHYPEGSAVYNFCYYLKTEQTFPNFVMKSVIGFVCGIILTYLCFMFFVFQLAISLIHATIMSSIIGVLLTLGLAFSYRIRCLVFLLIPQFFSRMGRYTLTCYALVLILTGPATNALKNSEVLSESLACAQEQVKTNMYQINESVKKPYNSMKDSIGLMVGGVKKLAAKIKKTTVNLHRLTLSLAHSLQSSFTWLNSVADSCNKHLGSPYKRCNEAIHHSVAECQAALGPWYSWLCDVGSLTQVACWPIKPLTSFCHVLYFANGNILGVVTKKLNAFSERINSMLYLEVHVHHSYSFSSNSSKSANQVAAGIVTEIRNRADLMLTWLSWSSCVTSLSLLLIIFRAKYYQHMYETRSRFDNRYVTKELIDLDLKRLRQGKETILPLNRREEGKYIKTTSFRLVSSEKVHLSRSAVTMAITTFKLLIHMVADYSLYWVLMTIRHHGLRQTPLKPGSPNAGAFVSGSALISKILMSLVGSITLPLATPPPSTITCLPNPYPPDFQRYSQIGILIFLLWFFALFEPYGLRLRHIIMGLYRKERAKARAVWLLNHIQRTRAISGSFIKFARRKLHREYKYLSENKYTFRRWLQDNIPCVGLKNFLGMYPDEPHCFLCGVIECCNECDGSLVRCDTPGCPGIYCTKCFSDIGQLCTICLSPADYGDMSDVSLEKGSSAESEDEDEPVPVGQYQEEPASHTDDDNNASSSKDPPKKKRRWSLFSRNKKKKKPEEFPLLEREDDKKDDKPTNERKLSKAMMVRHKKYVEFVFQDERRKTLVSLGQDASCSDCQGHCEICAIGKPAEIKNCKVQDITTYIAKGETKVNSRNRSTQRKKTIKTCNRKDFKINLRHSKQSLSINDSITKFKQHFKDMRKYALKKKRSHTVLNIKSSRMLPIKFSNSLRSVQYHKTRKKRLNILPKPSSNVFKSISISNFKISPLSVSIKSRRVEKYRINKKKRESLNTECGYNVMKLIYRNRYATANDCRQYSDSNSGTSKESYNPNAATSLMHFTDTVVPGPSKDKSVKKSPRRNVLNIRHDREDENMTKHAENKKSSQKTTKLYNLCTSYWKNGRIFPLPVRIVNYFRNDNVPALYATSNYKKRKKVESLEVIPNNFKCKRENEATRKYRISSYLSEQDWMKKRCKESKPDVNVKHQVLKDLLEAETEATRTLFRNIIMADKKDDIGGKGDNDNKNMIRKEHTQKHKVVKQEKHSKKPNIDTRESHDDIAKDVFPENNEKLTKKLKKVLDKKKADIQVPEPTDSNKYHKTKNKTNKKLHKNNNCKNNKKAGVVVFTPTKTNKSTNILSTIGYNVASKVTDTTSQPIQYRGVSIEYGGMSMSRSLDYYRSLGNYDFDPYMDIVDDSPAEIKTDKEATEKEIEVKVPVEDAKAQTTDPPIFITSIEGNSTVKVATIENDAPKPTSKKIKEAAKSARNTGSAKSEKCYNPFIMIVRWCQIHREKKKQRAASSSQDGQSKIDAVAEVYPRVQNNYCQYGETVPIQDQTTQVYVLKEVAQSMSQHSDLFRDVGVDAVTRMRNGATQYTYSCRNASTFYQGKKYKRPDCTDASTLHFNALKADVENCTMTAKNKIHHLGVQCRIEQKDNLKENIQDYVAPDIHRFEMLQKNKFKNKQEDKDKEKPQQNNSCCPEKMQQKQAEKTCAEKTLICPYCGAKSSSETNSSLGIFQSITSLEGGKQLKSYDSISDSDESITGESKIVEAGRKKANKELFKTDSEDTKTTDTTVFQVSNWDYEPPRRTKARKLKLSVITKSNQATCTESTKLCDVSTVTNDWWSPILERKVKTISLSKKTAQDRQSPERERKKFLKDRSVGTEGRIVTFSSKAQIIPSLHTHLNLMSPSRYLLESQRYYNELFSNKYYPMTSNATEQYASDKRYSSIRRRHVLQKRNYKMKRSDECTQNEINPFMEQVWTAETMHQQLPTSSVHRKARHPVSKGIMGSQSKGLQTKGVKKSKHPQRYSFKKPELKIKKGEVNLLIRRYLSNDNISLDSHCNSLAETGSF